MQWSFAVACCSELSCWITAGSRSSSSRGARDQDAGWWHAGVRLIMEHGADHGSACLQHIQEQLRERDT